jgi:ribosome biogenesis protein Nip4
MIKPITDFAKQFNASLNWDERLIVWKENRYFLITGNMKRLLNEDFFYAGTYLGKVKSEQFFPSFSLLQMISEQQTNKVYVDRKSAWLFICGRDIFKRGIVRAEGAKSEGSCILVLNEFGECLGFGRLVCGLDREEGAVAVKNISDIGDFLRREEHR